MPLFIVATPIGNLGDISPRALACLKTADVVLCEDTRQTVKLLNHYEIKVKTLSYHQHSNATKVNEIRALLDDGQKVALVSDAGTPGISDPGNRLIADLVAQNPDLEISPLPGASAMISALSVSGFPTDHFSFRGFPPHKKGRQTYFRELGSSTDTVVFYESNHRIEKCLKELGEVLTPNRQVMVARELTKQFESIYRGTMAELLNKKIPPKGEFVVVISETKR